MSGKTKEARRALFVANIVLDVMQLKTPTYKQMVDSVLSSLKISEEILKANGLEIEYVDYGIYRLPIDRKYVFEGTEIECHVKAYEIIYES